MHHAYTEPMSRTVQIRDLDDEVYRVLRERAVAADLSLSQYLRRELTQLAALPTMSEWLDRIDRTRERSGVEQDAIVRALHDSRAERDAQIDDRLDRR